MAESESNKQDDWQTLLQDAFYEIESKSVFSMNANIVRKEAVNRLKQSDNYNHSEKLKIKKLLSYENVKKWINEQPVAQIHKPIRRKYPRPPVFAKSVDQIWMVDVAYMKSYAKYNSNMGYILCCVDVFSRWAACRLVKSTKSENVAEKFREILESEHPRKPTIVCSDKGGEFIGKSFQELLKSKNIRFYTATDPNFHASLAERWIRTLKGLISRYMTSTGEVRYETILQSLVSAYNRRIHSSLPKISPMDVVTKPELYKKVYNHLYTKRWEEHGRAVFKFNITDRVRISMNRKVGMEKGYEAGGWSDEIFTVHRRIGSRPVKYTLKDSQSNIIQGSFFNQELQKIPNKSNTTRKEKIIKVLRTRKRRGLDQHEQLVVYRGKEKYAYWIPLKREETKKTVK